MNYIRYIAKILQNKPVHFIRKTIPRKIVTCDEYWNDMKKLGLLQPLKYKEVTYHGELNSFNHMLVGFGSCNFKQKCINTNISIAKVITKTDFDFKRLLPIENSITVYRCIRKRPDYLEDVGTLFKKSTQTQKGDIVTLKEYAYCSPQKDYAECFLSDGGIIYEIQLPKGAKISQRGADCVLPRYFRAECLSNELTNEGYHYIKLRGILPEEKWRMW